MKIFGITGWKNSGKTGLTERLVSTFIARGYSVSTIKHTHHAVDLDHAGTDSFRHRTAGANEVMLASGSRSVIMQEHRDEAPSLAELVARLAPVDLVLVEGFKSAPIPKIECIRAEAAQGPLYPDNPHVCALARDLPQNTQLPQFDLNDTGAIADFIAAQIDLSENNQ